MESSINAPHVHEDDAEAFFNPPAAETAAEAAPEEVEPVEAAPAPAAEGVDPPFDAPTASQEPAGGDETGQGGGEDPQEPREPAEAASEKQRGALSREYIVFHKLSLGVEHLRELIASIERGEMSHVDAYIELHRREARNDRVAIASAYKAHSARLGERAELAVVSERSFKVRQVEPEDVPAERRLKIT